MSKSGELEVVILGCGSSGGVPRLGGPDEAGNWGDCDPANPRNRRRRCSILVTRKSPDGETRVLVDTAPDLREQLLDARIGRLVFGASDDKTGACGGVFNLIDDPRHNHRVAVTSGVLGPLASVTLSNYFRAKRGRPLLPLPDNAGQRDVPGVE